MSHSKEYTEREMKMMAKDAAEIEALPMVERRENYKEFAADMEAMPRLIAERIGWLLTGSYGFGQMILAQRALETRNPKAHLFRLIAIFEWRTGRSYAAKAWRLASEATKVALNKAIDAEIEYFKANYEMEKV